MTSTTTRRLAAGVLALSLMLGAAACSDDEEGTTDESTEESAEEGTSSEDYTAEEMGAALQEGSGFSEETATCITDAMFEQFDQERINEIAASADAYATDAEYQALVQECAEANGETAPEPAEAGATEEEGEG